MKCYILCGGKGTRLAELNKDARPKPLVEIAGKPILEWQLLQLSKYKINDIIIIASYKSEMIDHYLLENKEKNKEKGLSVSLIREATPLGTGGLLKTLYASNILQEEYLVIYGDVIFKFDFDKFFKFKQDFNFKNIVTTHKSSHPKDSNCVQIQEHKIVKWFDKGEAPDYLDNSVTGIRLLSNDIFRDVEDKNILDLDKEVLMNYYKNNELGAYYTEEFMRDVGTIEGFLQVEKIIKEGLFDE